MPTTTPSTPSVPLAALRAAAHMKILKERSAARLVDAAIAAATERIVEEYHS